MDEPTKRPGHPLSTVVAGKALQMLGRQTGELGFVRKGRQFETEGKEALAKLRAHEVLTQDNEPPRR